MRNAGEEEVFGGAEARFAITPARSFGDLSELGDPLQAIRLELLRSDRHNVAAGEIMHENQRVAAAEPE